MISEQLTDRRVEKLSPLCHLRGMLGGQRLCGDNGRGARREEGRKAVFQKHVGRNVNTKVA